MDFIYNLWKKQNRQFDIHYLQDLPSDIQKEIVKQMHFNDLDCTAEIIQKKFFQMSQGYIAKKTLGSPEIVLQAKELVAFNISKNHVIGLQYLLQKNGSNVIGAYFVIAKKGYSKPIEKLEFLPERVRPYSWSEVMSIGPFALSAHADQFFL